MTTHFGVVTLTQGRPTSWTRLHDPQSTLIEFALRLQQPVSVSMATPPPVPSTNQKERDTMETDCISRNFHVLSLSLSLSRNSFFSLFSSFSSVVDAFATEFSRRREALAFASTPNRSASPASPPPVHRSHRRRPARRWIRIGVLL